MQAALFFSPQRAGRQSGRCAKAESWLSALRSETIDHCSAKKSISVLCGRDAGGRPQKKRTRCARKDAHCFFDF